MFRQGMYVRLRDLNFTGQIILENATLGNVLIGEPLYLVSIRHGKGNEKAKQFFKTDFFCQCRESNLEFVCLN